jgi:hypothetical protein
MKLLEDTELKEISELRRIRREYNKLRVLRNLMIYSLKINIETVYPNFGARGSLVGRGNMLQAARVRFPLRSFNFSIALILPAALCS